MTRILAAGTLAAHRPTTAVLEAVPDLVDRLNALTVTEAAEVLSGLAAAEAVEVLDQSALVKGPAILVALDPVRATELLAGMAADRAADLLGALSPADRAALMRRLDGDTRAALDRLLAYAEGTVGALMTTEFVAVPSTWTVAEALDHVRRVERTRETVYAVFVEDAATGVLLHAVPLRRLVAGEPGASVLTAVSERPMVTVAATAPADEAVRIVARHDFLAVPVVDAGGRLIGIVTVDDVIDTMVARQTDQVQRMGGMEATGYSYWHTGFWQMLRKRGGWLSILLVGEMMTASAMQGFQGELEKAIVLSLFIPLIMSSGGNSGSQAASLVIRGLALGEIRLTDWWRVALRELPSGLALGALLGVIAVGRIVAWQQLGIYDHGPHWPLVAATVGLALVCIVTFGSMNGSMLPFVLKRLGFDPATASAPFVATLVDVSGLVIYFSVALVVLRGTLL